MSITSEISKKVKQNLNLTYGETYCIHYYLEYMILKAYTMSELKEVDEDMYTLAKKVRKNMKKWEAK